MAISINIKELHSLLDTTPATHNVMLVGKHGIGKSEILTAYFSEKNMPVVSLFLGQMSDPGDLIGLPHKNEKTGKTDFMPPYWFPLDGKPIVLFLDELNRARPEVLQTIMDLALNRKLAGRALPEGSRIISAVNEGEEYQLTDLDPALVSRFNIYGFRPGVDEWLLWAAKHKLDQRVITFISENVTLLDSGEVTEDTGLEKKPDRRGWKRVSDIILGVTELTDIHKKLIAGIVGLSAANRFYKAVSESKTISGKEAMLHFEKHKQAIARLPLHELSVLNEAIFRYLETDGHQDKKNSATISRALSEYVQLLLDLDKSEAFAHWITLYSGGSYKQTTAFILTKSPTLYGKIQNFIMEL